MVRFVKNVKQPIRLLVTHQKTHARTSKTSGTNSPAVLLACLQLLLLHYFISIELVGLLLLRCCCRCCCCFSFFDFGPVLPSLSRVCCSGQLQTCTLQNNPLSRHDRLLQFACNLMFLSCRTWKRWVMQVRIWFPQAQTRLRKRWIEFKFSPLFLRAMELYVNYSFYTDPECTAESGSPETCLTMLNMRDEPAGMEGIPCLTFLDTIVAHLLRRDRLEACWAS